MTDQPGLFDLDGPDGEPDTVPAAGPATGSAAVTGTTVAAPGAPRRRLVVETDGGSRGNPGPAGYGAAVRDASTGELLAERAGYLGVVSNNVAEYTGLVEGLRAAAEIDPDAAVEVRADSKLVVEQMSGRWKIKHADMRTLADRARAVLPPERVTYTWVPRAENKVADALANAAMDTRADVRRDHRAAAPATIATLPGGSLQGDALPGGVGTDADDSAAADASAPRVSGTPLPRLTGQPATIVLVRHGVTVLTETGRYSGGDTVGPPLSEVGREQARRAGALVRLVGSGAWEDLPVPVAVVTSPMVRAAETGAAVAVELGLEPTTDDRFAECRFGEWDELTVPQIEEGWPGQLFRWATEADVRPPGGESLRDVGNRVTRGLRDLAAGYVSSTVVVAAHTVVIRAALGLVGHVPIDHWSAVRIPPASMTILRLWPQVDAQGRLVGDITVVGCPSELTG